jgi:hypothetical protein
LSAGCGSRCAHRRARSAVWPCCCCCCCWRRPPGRAPHTSAHGAHAPAPSSRAPCPPRTRRSRWPRAARAPGTLQGDGPAHSHAERVCQLSWAPHAAAAAVTTAQAPHIQHTEDVHQEKLVIAWRPRGQPFDSSPSSWLSSMVWSRRLVVHVLNASGPRSCSPAITMASSTAPIPRTKLRPTQRRRARPRLWRSSWPEAHIV